MSTIESAFYQYMNFDTDEAVNIRAKFLDFFANSDNILELAPGDGAFLEKLQSMGKSVMGVDSDPGMVERACQRNLTVVCDDVFNFLRHSSTKFDGIYASHLVEHLKAEAVVELFSLCRKALTDQGGILVVVTPNPASLFTQLHEFWRDPTHERFYTLDLLCFLFEHCGYEIIDQGDNPKLQVKPHQLIYPTPNEAPQVELAGVTASPKKSTAPLFIHKFIHFIRRWIVGPQLDEFDKLRHQVAHNARATTQFMIDLYPPNEIYVAGRVKSQK